MTISVAGSQTWIRDTCRQFSDAIGWELEFVPAPGGRGDEIEARLRSDPSTCWFSEITDGHERIGFLQLVLPDDASKDRSFNSVGDLADTFAQLVNRSVTAARVAESRTDEVVTLVDIGRSVPTERNLVDALQKLLEGATQLTPFRSSRVLPVGTLDRAAQAPRQAHRDAPLIPPPVRSLSRESSRLAGPFPRPDGFGRRNDPRVGGVAAPGNVDGRLPGGRLRGRSDRHACGSTIAAAASLPTAKCTCWSRSPCRWRRCWSAWCSCAKVRLNTASSETCNWPRSAKRSRRYPAAAGRGHRSRDPLDQSLRDRRRLVRIDSAGRRANGRSPSATHPGTAFRRRS